MDNERTKCEDKKERILRVKKRTENIKIKDTTQKRNKESKETGDNIEKERKMKIKKRVNNENIQN